MATLSDVESALGDLITAALYPNAGAPPSAAGHPVKIYAGWPDQGTLEADLTETNGLPAASHVSIYPLPAERNTTRFPVTWIEGAIPAPTYFLTVWGQTITVAGSPPSPYFAQNFAAYVNGTPYVVQASAGQTPAQIAQALCAAIQADVPGASVTGAVITLPALARIGDVRVGVTGSTAKEVRRQERQFQISVWSSSPTLRALIADLFDPVMADTPRLALADGFTGQMIYHGAREDDFVQKQRIYRRSLIYSVEYPTTITRTAPQLIVGEVELPIGPVIDILDFTDPSYAVLAALL